LYEIARNIYEIASFFIKSKIWKFCYGERGWELTGPQSHILAGRPPYGPKYGCTGRRMVARVKMLLVCELRNYAMAKDHADSQKHINCCNRSQNIPRQLPSVHMSSYGEQGKSHII
jgi:hypothetical protein